MADISKIVLGGTTYNIKDTVARAAAVGGMHFLGVSLSQIADGTTNVAIIKTSTNTANRYYTGTAPTGTTYTDSSTTYTLTNVKLNAGDVVIHRSLEFVFSDSDSKWHELGSTGTLGKLAYQNNISVTYSKATGGTFEGTKATISVSGSTSGVKVDSHSYTPAGTISGTVKNGTPGTTTVVRSVNTSKLVTTTIYPQEISAPTGEVKVSTSTVKASTTSLRGVAGTTTAVNASYANETLTLSAVTAATANAASTTVATGLTGTTTFATGLEGTTTFVKSATLSTATTGGTTVATGSVDSTNGTGATVATGVSNDNYAAAITSLGTPSFSGSFTGTTKTIAHTVTQGSVTASGSYTPAGSVTVTNSNDSAEVSLS